MEYDAHVELLHISIPKSLIEMIKIKIKMMRKIKVRKVILIGFLINMEFKLKFIQKILMPMKNKVEMDQRGTLLGLLKANKLRVPKI